MEPRVNQTQWHAQSNTTGSSEAVREQQVAEQSVLSRFWPREDMVAG